MSLALAATGRLSSVTNFLASSRISMMLFSRAKSGANGKEATNSVTNPNWMTVRATTQRPFIPQSLSMYISFIHPTSVLIISSGSQTLGTNRKDVVLEHFHPYFEREHEGENENKIYNDFPNFPISGISQEEPRRPGTSWRTATTVSSIRLPGWNQFLQASAGKLSRLKAEEVLFGFQTSRVVLQQLTQDVLNYWT